MRDKETLKASYKSMFGSPAWLHLMEKFKSKRIDIALNVLKTRTSMPRDFHFVAGQQDILGKIQKLAEYELKQLEGSSDKESK